MEHIHRRRRLKKSFNYVNIFKGNRSMYELLLLDLSIDDLINQSAYLMLHQVGPGFRDAASTESAIMTTAVSLLKGLGPG
jgi:hypothetical protein